MTTATPSVTSLLQHRDWIRQLAHKLVHDQSQVDDVVQRAWLAAVERPPRDLSNPRGWLTRVVQRQAMVVSRETRRRAKRERAAARPEALPAAVEVAARADLHRKVVDTVLALEDPYRSVLLLHYFDGRKLREIAQELGRPEGTVKTWLHRGLERMRSLLDEAHGDRRSWCLALVPLAAPAGGAPSVLASAASVFAWALAGCLALALAWFGWRAFWPEAPALGPSSGAEVAARADGPAEPVDRPDAERVAERAPVAMAAAGVDQDPLPAPAQRAVLRGTIVDTTGAPLAGLELVYRSEHWPVVLEDGRVRIGNTTMDLRAEDRAALRARPEWIGRGMPFLEPEAQRALGAWLAGEDGLARCVSDAQGHFELSGTENWWRVEVQRERWMVYGAVETDSEPLLVVGPGVALAGRVVDEAGSPIEDAYLSLSGTIDRLPEWTRKTSGDAFRSWDANADAEGHFDLGRVPSHSKLSLTVQRRGYASLTVDVPSVDTADALYVLAEDDDQQVLTGRVLLADGTPAAGAGVMFGQDGGATDEQGRFTVQLSYWSKETILGAYLKPYQPAFMHGLGAAIRERAEAGHDLELRLGPELQEIRGRLLDARGRPVAGAVVGLTDGVPFGSHVGTTFESWLGGWRSTGLRTDEEGEFVVPGLSSRPYHVFARIEDSFVVVESGSVAAGATDLILRVPEDPVHDVSGHVVDRHGGPIAGVQVCVRHVYGGGSTRRVWVRDDRAITDERGRFLLRGCPRQHVSVEVAGDGIEFVDVPAEEVRDGLRIEVPRIMELRVTGTPADGLAFRFVDAAGETVQMTAHYPSVVCGELTADVEGEDAAPILEVIDRAVELVLEQNGTELRRIPLQWTPGTRLDIRL